MALGSRVFFDCWQNNRSSCRNYNATTNFWVCQLCLHFSLLAIQGIFNISDVSFLLYCRNETLFSLKWLEEKQIISKLLNVYYRNLFCVSKASLPVLSL
jgi:hypothetical protein